MDKNINNIEEKSLHTTEEIENQNIALKKLFSKLTLNEKDSLEEKKDFIKNKENIDN